MGSSYNTFFPNSGGAPVPAVVELTEPQKPGGRRPSHTAKFDRCVSKVSGKVANPFATCTGTLGSKAFLRPKTSREATAHIPAEEWHQRILKLGKLIRQHRQAKGDPNLCQETRGKR